MPTPMERWVQRNGHSVIFSRCVVAALRRRVTTPGARGPASDIFHLAARYLVATRSFSAPRAAREREGSRTLRARGRMRNSTTEKTKEEPGTIWSDLGFGIPAGMLADAVGENETTGMDYHIQIIGKEDRPKVLKFLRRFFFRDEPLNHSIQLIPEGEDSTCIELEDYSLSALADNLSLMAISSSGAIIGVQLNGKMEPPEDGEPEYIGSCKNPKFRKILRLLHHVDKSVNIPSRYPGQKVLEIRIISVDSNWRGRGIAGALVEKTLEIAHELGFHMIRSDCTSLFSGKLCKRYGFEPVYELKYTDYVDENGAPIFAPAFPHVSVITWVKQLCGKSTSDESDQ